MRWWIDGMIRSLGTQGALDNVRRQLEARRLQLDAVDALVRRHGAAPAARRKRPAA